MPDLGYLGRFQQGTELPVACRAVNSSDVPANPLATPELTVYLDGVQVAAEGLGADLQGVADGTFRLSLFLGSAFAEVGLYTLLVRYATASGEPRALTGTFEVIPGGSADGAVIAMCPFALPDRRYLVQQLDSGKLVRGRNPR